MRKVNVEEATEAVEVVEEENTEKEITLWKVNAEEATEVAEVVTEEVTEEEIMMRKVKAEEASEVAVEVVEEVETSFKDTDPKIKKVTDQKVKKLLSLRERDMNKLITITVEEVEDMVTRVNQERTIILSTDMMALVEAEVAPKREASARVTGVQNKSTERRMLMKKVLKIIKKKREKSKKLIKSQ
jgi:hypothetical protein